MDGGILIDETTGFATGAGEGIYAYNAAVNAIFYEPATPNLSLATNKSMVNFPGNGYLEMPNSADFEFGTGDFTIETWMYLTKDQDNRSLFGTDADGSNSGAQIEFVSGDEHIATYDYDLEGNWNEVTKSNKPIPLGKWIHFAYVRESLSFYMYIDGVRQSSTGFTSSNAVGHSSGPYWGKHRNNSGRYLDDVYLDQMRISNNARYSVNFTPPTAPFTADANTLSLIQSTWSEGTIGADHSGNYNTFTPNNMGVGESIKDSPLTNFCTVNPLSFARSGNTTSLWGRATEGNLRWTSAGSQWGGHTFFSSTMAIPPNTGKWYWEMCDIGNSGNANFSSYCWGVGMMPTDDGPNVEQVLGLNNNINSNSGAWYVKSNSEVGTVRQYKGGTSSENRIVPCDAGTFGPKVFKFCYDSDAGLLYFGGDLGWMAHDTVGAGNIITADFPSTSQYLFNNLNLYTVTPCYNGYQSAQFTDNMQNFGQDATFGGNVQGTPAYATDGNGYGEFYYEPPSGYKALCAANLPTPSIALPGEYFDTALYTGTGSELSVSDLSFQPDFTWIKTRELAYNNRVFDVVRGVTKELYTNANNTEVTDAQSLKSFDSNGFTLGTSSGVNPSSDSNMVSWNWKAGGAPTVDNSAGAGATPTAGSVKINGSNLGSALAGSRAATRLSANTTAGFSIVEFVGDTTVQTIAHGLSQKPEMIIEKAIGGSQHWLTGHDDLNKGSSPWNYYVYLSLDSAESASTNAWDDTAPTSSVFTIGSGLTTGGNSPYIAYCFHSVEGYSKVGSYKGNGDPDGSFIYTGFKPAYTLIKRVDSTNDWMIGDDKTSPYNVTDNMLRANLDNGQQSGNNVDYVSNGFKIRISGNAFNNSSGTYVYVAFAESPFKYSNAR